jgi:hypothetical protein
MANHLARIGLPWDDEDSEGSVPAFFRRAKTLTPRGRARWVDEDESCQAIIGRWTAHVSRCSDAPGSWEWRAFASSGPPPRAVGGRAWKTRDDAQRDAELMLDEL